MGALWGLGAVVALGFVAWMLTRGNKDRITSQVDRNKVDYFSSTVNRAGLRDSDLQDDELDEDDIEGGALRGGYSQRFDPYPLGAGSFVIEEDVRVSGVQYRMEELNHFIDYIEHAGPENAFLGFEWEPDNPYDPHALAVYGAVDLGGDMIKSYHIGYVPKELAARLFRSVKGKNIALFGSIRTVRIRDVGHGDCWFDLWGIRK